MTQNIFVSYSHRDAELVSPVVKLLRLNTPLVFHDTDSIPTGKKWREQVSHALDQAHLVVLFWCAHSSRSDEVENEYRSALQLHKDILPVLLDDTPLPAALGEFQWIDFRSVVRPSHEKEVLDFNNPAQKIKTRNRWAVARASLATAAVFATAASVGLYRWMGIEERAETPAEAPGSQTPPPDPSTIDLRLDEALLWPVLIAIIAVLAIAAWVAVRRKSRREAAEDLREIVVNRARELPEWQGRMAQELELEILRRAPPAQTNKP